MESPHIQYPCLLYLVEVHLSFPACFSMGNIRFIWNHLWKNLKISFLNVGWSKKTVPSIIDGHNFLEQFELGCEESRLLMGFQMSITPH